MPIVRVTATKIRKSVIPALLIFCVFLYGLIPLKDFDFWWHIKTGQYILEHRALPDGDPFTYTFLERDPDMPDWAPVVLKSFWLSQIIFFIAYLAAGPLGIILFKSFIFGLILTLLWKYLMENSASTILSVIMLAGFIFFSREFMAERPQIFSFLFATVVFYLLERIRSGYRAESMAESGEEARRAQLDGSPIAAARSTPHPVFFILLPSVMILWANMHRGYPVGVAFIVVYALGLLHRRFLSRKGMSSAGKAWSHKCILVCLVSISVTMLNPVTYRPLTTLIAFQGSALQTETMEFSPLLSVLSYLSVNWYPFFVFMAVSVIIIGMHAASMIQKKGKGGADPNQTYSYVLPPEHVLLLGGTISASLTSLRYGMFFMLVGVPVITLYLSRRLGPRIPQGLRRIGIAIAGVLLLVLFLRSPLFGRSRGILLNETVLPVSAAEFIKQKSLPANIYNDINWGGYLIWKLYPGYRMFSDTRTLNLEIYRQYLSILNAHKRMFFGIPEWRALLDMYRINTIVHSTVNPYSGEIYPLMRELLRDDTWHLVYADGVAAILVREMPPALRELPKELLLEEMRRERMRRMERFPNRPAFLRTLSLLGQMR